jgi:hypothetical protein
MARNNRDFIVAEEMALEEFDDLNTESKIFPVQISFQRDATLSSLYFISYRVTLHVSGALCAHHQEF